MLVTDLLKGLSPEPMLLEVEWVRDRASRVMLADGTVTKEHAVRRRSLVKQTLYKVQQRLYLSQPT